MPIASIKFPSDLGSDKEAHYVSFIARDNKPGSTNINAHISMYMPASSLRTSYAAKYTDQSGIIDDVASAVFEAVDTNQGTLANQTLGVLQAIKQSSGFEGTVGRMLTNSLSKADIGKRLLAGTKVALNPKMGLMFDGSGEFRIHKFDFNLIARSVTESNTINKIILEFKKALLPSLTQDANTNSEFGSNFFNYPDFFEIYFGHSNTGKEFIPFKIHNSVLTNMDVNYSGSDIPVFFKNTNEPMNVTLSLSFTELQILTKHDAEQGY